MSYARHHHDAHRISSLLEPDSVDLIVTSPPYFGLRSYTDEGEHYDGQIGCEDTPVEFLDALIGCTADWLTVLKPGGSIWVNLGDKYANGTPGIPDKSLLGMPWRYALRCIDQLGLILRAEVIWDKRGGMPESVTDRVRRSHEQWFHLTREGIYFAAIDEIREEHAPQSLARTERNRFAPDLSQEGVGNPNTLDPEQYCNPLGKLPGSVWSIATEPLLVPDSLGVDHFAAFPSEWPRRIILGWSPSGYCTVCDEPRRPDVDRRRTFDGEPFEGGSMNPATMRNRTTNVGVGNWRFGNETRILGYTCACPTPDAPTRPAVILDPFVGTGTTVAVAHLLGRHGVGTDLSADYLRLAEWRCTKDRGLRDKFLDRTGIPNPKAPKIDGQLDLFA